MRLPKSVFLSTKLVSTDPATHEFVLRFGNAVLYPEVLYRYLSYNGKCNAANVCKLLFTPETPEDEAGFAETARWSAISDKLFYPDQDHNRVPNQHFELRYILDAAGGPATASPSHWTPGTLELTVIEKCCPYS